VRNLYKVLGIASTADDLRIKSAFRRRALTTHPDLNPGNDAAEERFRELMQAYEVLRDAKARALYDAHLAWQRSQSRRRFVQSAAVMVATFVLTTSSTIFVAGLQGINVHSETWQIATAWLTSVEVEPSLPGRPPVTEAVKAMPSATTTVPAAASKAPPPARSSKRETEPPAKAQGKAASAGPKMATAPNDPAQPQAWWPW
jgi:curved DNA-binding protein CbpA